MIWSLLNSIPQFQYTGDYAICGGCDDLPHSNATLFRSLLLCCTRRFVTIARLSTLLSFFLWVKHFIARKFFSRRCKKISTSYSRSLLTLQRPYMGWNNWESMYIFLRIWPNAFWTGGAFDLIRLLYLNGSTVKCWVWNMDHKQSQSKCQFYVVGNGPEVPLIL